MLCCARHRRRGFGAQRVERRLVDPERPAALSAQASSQITQSGVAGSGIEHEVRLASFDAVYGPPILGRNIDDFARRLIHVPGRDLPVTKRL